MRYKGLQNGATQSCMKLVCRHPIGSFERHHCSDFINTLKNPGNAYKFLVCNSGVIAHLLLMLLHTGTLSHGSTWIPDGEDIRFGAERRNNGFSARSSRTALRARGFRTRAAAGPRVPRAPGGAEDLSA